MLDYTGTLRYKDREYRPVFSIDVMERVQQEYGSFQKWADLAEGAAVRDGEPDIRALKFALLEMLNEGIRIENEDNGTDLPLLTARQVSRIIDEIGLNGANRAVSETVSAALADDEKNG